MKKVNSVSNATVTVSLKRSPTIEPITLVNDAFSRWAIYPERHTSPRRGKSRFTK